MSKAKILGRLFSKTDRALDALTREKGTGTEFLRELEKTPGVKAQEIKDRGLDKALPAMGKTTKTEVKKVLERNPPPKIQEEVLGGKPNDMPEWGMLNDENPNAPKYGEYQIPGGENYREILLKLPPKKEGFSVAYSPSMNGWVINSSTGRTIGPFANQSAATDEYLSLLMRQKENDYFSRHWSQPNVLAHARVSDRVGPNGEKILHIEEIQSDWHQTGRKEGYKTGEEKQRITELAKQYDDLTAKRRELLKRAEEMPGHGAEFTSAINEANDITPQLMRLQTQMDTLRSAAQRGVPDAPFKKNWHELTMKRLLDYATENGYDRLAITPGAKQAERYDLSKQVDELVYKDGILHAYKDGRLVIDQNNVPEGKLPDYVGKEVAKKLIDQTPNEYGTRTIGGVDLQVGGEGMRGFYDKILPDYLNSLGKPYGTQVGTYDLDGIPLHSFDITPPMREEIKSKGLPLYQQIGVPIGAGAAGAAAVQEPAEPEYRKGGPVKRKISFLTNPDAMRLELMSRSR